MYQDGRYLTITGRTLEDTNPALADNQEQLTTVYHRIFQPAQELRHTENTGLGKRRERYASIARSDEEVLQRTYQAKNGANFKRYYEGDYSLWEGGAHDTAASRKQILRLF